MNTHGISGFLDGYCFKQANVGAAALGSAALGAGGEAANMASETAATMIPYALLLPAVVGAGVGAAHSKLTSPTMTDMDTVQKALETSKLEEYATELNRQREEALEEEEKLNKQKEHGSARTLRI